MGSLRIRTATADDALALSRLLGQLGYPSDAADIPARLRKLEARPGTVVLIAEENQSVVGCVSVHVFYALHANEPTAWLTAVVVDEAARGKGVGSAMIEYAEAWASENGARHVALTSALYRKEAHEFYKARDYEHTGVRLVKVLVKSPPSSASDSSQLPQTTSI